MAKNFPLNTNEANISSSPPPVSVVILAYGNRDFVERCLQSLQHQTWPRMEILFVDNASKDDSAAVARRTIDALQLPGRVIELPRNLGCAGGNNAGWRAAAGDIIVFLNPDTELRPDCIEKLIDPLLADPAIGITGAKMYYPGGRLLQHAGALVHPNGMTNHHGAGEEDHGQHDALRDVDYVTGAGFAIAAEFLRELGGFDEDYFPAYYEEVDLCLRARRAGRRVIYTPHAVLTHHESVSLGKDSTSLHRLFPRMRIRYLLKNLTLRQIALWAVPFEYRWMRHEPAARGYRWNQIRHGWLANIPWALGWLLRGRSRPGVHPAKRA